MNRSGIEWCDHTWNPITGCRHNCPYCYARRMTARFSGDVRLNKMAKTDYCMVEAADKSEAIYLLDTPMLNETEKPLVYPFGFEPTYHRYRRDTLDKLKVGNNVFVGAMSDMFGVWVPDEWIKEIFEICKKHPIHNYLFLTKNPGRYESLDDAGMLPAGKNFWYGSTLTRPEDKCFISSVHNTFWSIEPIHAPFRLWEKDKFSPNWIIIGAETGKRHGKIIPLIDWITDIVMWCKQSKTPVFMKDSLIPIVGEENMQREFPVQLKELEKISPKMHAKMFDTCTGCGMQLKKSDMILLFAKFKRREYPKQAGYMCRECFKKFCREFNVDIPFEDLQANQGKEQKGNDLNLSIKDKLTDYYETLDLQEEMTD